MKYIEIFAITVACIGTIFIMPYMPPTHYGAEGMQSFKEAIPYVLPIWAFLIFCVIKTYE